jgi:hypothetical protein
MNILLTVYSILVALACGEIGLRMLGIGVPPAFAPHPQYGYLTNPNQLASTRGRESLSAQPVSHSESEF